MKRRYRYDPNTQELIEIAASEGARLHYIQPDLPGYESPVTGKWIEGRRARRDDLKRTGSRPWEGMEAEKKEAARVRARQETKLDQLAERMAHRAWAEAPERVRKVFRSK